MWIDPYCNMIFGSLGRPVLHLSNTILQGGIVMWSQDLPAYAIPREGHYGLGSKLLSICSLD